MRIAFLPASAVMGGAERVLLEMVEALRQAEPAWRLCVVCPEEGPLAAALRACGAEVRVVALPAALASLGESGASRLAARLPRALPALLGYLRALHRTLAELAPDVVHTNGLKMHLLGALARPAGSRLVWHLHDFLAGRPAMRRLLRLTQRRCSVAVAVSQAVAADAAAALRPGLPVRVVRNRVDLARFTPEGPAAPLASLAGLPPEERGTVRVGLVATLGLWKGHEVFLRSLALLPHDVAVRGYVVGGSLYRPLGSEVSLESLRARAAQLGVGDRVGFTGFVAEPAEAMRALDVVVHGSTQPEPFGLVIAEAMACGRAVVASHAGGAAELLHPGEDGLACPPGDAAALARCIAQLARDPGLRARLGAAARARAVREFGRGGLAGELSRVYGAGT